MNPSCCHPSTETRTQTPAQPPTVAETRAPETPRTVAPRHRLDTLPEKAGWELHVELPGVRKEDVKVSHEKDSLVIEAVRSQATPESWRSVRVSRPAVAGYRLALSVREDLIDTGALAASLEHGVLRLRLPVKAAVPARVVPVE